MTPPADILKGAWRRRLFADPADGRLRPAEWVMAGGGGPNPNDAPWEYEGPPGQPSAANNSVLLGGDGLAASCVARVLQCSKRAGAGERGHHGEQFAM